MKRITLLIPDDVYQRLKDECRQRDISPEDLVRDALEAFLGRAEGRRTLPFAALGASGYHDTARNAEEILREHWGGASGR
jgi:hypothetical protein